MTGNSTLVEPTTTMPAGPTTGIPTEVPAEVLRQMTHFICAGCGKLVPMSELGTHWQQCPEHGANKAIAARDRAIDALLARYGELARRLRFVDSVNHELAAENERLKLRVAELVEATQASQKFMLALGAAESTLMNELNAAVGR